MRFKISTAHGTTCFMRRSLPSSFNGSRRQAPWIVIYPYYYSIRGTAVCVYRFSHFQATGLVLMSHISLAYWAMVRSLLNLPLPAVFKMDILIHFFLSLSQNQSNQSKERKQNITFVQKICRLV
jgi:hypothetical protein